MMPAATGSDIAFGPVPSRRLGQSLGINNIPRKSCSYNCVYCQVGVTLHPTVERRAFYAPQQIVAAVRDRLAALAQHGERVDYLSFVPDGEPTLDSNLHTTIAQLKPLGVPVAVISNASLICDVQVRASLALADLVSLKVDSTDEDSWRRINQPCADLVLADILDGIRQFAHDYRGTLITETMLVEGLNDSTAAIAQTADFIRELNPAMAYIAIPTRPPANASIRPASADTLVFAHETFHNLGIPVELLLNEVPGEFGYTGDVAADMLRTAMVHPLSAEAVQNLLDKAGAGPECLAALLAQGLLAQVQHAGKPFYVRTWKAA